MTVQPTQQKNEGEGNRTAAKQYDDATTKFANSGKVEPAAKKAAESLDTAEADELSAAEAKGKRPAHGEREI